MHPEDRVDLGILEAVQLHHELGAKIDFLRRLEQELDASLDLAAERRKDRRCTEQRSRMCIVSARMHPSVDRGAVVAAGFFLDRQSIDIRTERDARSVLSPPEQSDDPRFQAYVEDLDAKTLQMGFDKSSRLILMKAQFRVLVQVLQRRNEFVIMLDHQLAHSGSYV